MLWRVVQICFANASLSPPLPSAQTVTVAWWRQASLLVLLTGILCVDECAGLTAQCAYLIGAALLSHRVSLSPSLPAAHLTHIFSEAVRRVFHLA